MTSPLPRDVSARSCRLISRRFVERISSRSLAVRRLTRRSERGYRSRMAVTLGQGLGQLDSTYPVTRKKPTWIYKRARARALCTVRRRRIIRG